MGVQRLAIMRDLGLRIMSTYRAVVTTPANQRPALVAELSKTRGMRAALVDTLPRDAIAGMPPPMDRIIKLNMALVPLPPWLRPHAVLMQEQPAKQRLLVAMRLPDTHWLVLRLTMPAPRPWHSPTFLAAFALMTVAAAALVLWAVRRLTEPLRTLAAAAERLGRDVNAPPLSEEGPSEIAIAAAAFNTMAARIRRFVQDRMFLLTAIGHDLRTPITRLKLRAEFIEDDEQRSRILADLDELEAMVTATLQFGREAASGEPVRPVDLPALLRTVLDEAADARPEAGARLDLDGPEHLTVRARPIALKRAYANLVGNALAYGEAAHVRLRPPHEGVAVVEIEDEGPGIPPTEIERVFEPFRRGEPSRNRETGGTGLGLPIARNIVRAHGGDVTLGNRAGGGARAVVTLPV
jgi:signal transduction histidine kinase